MSQLLLFTVVVVCVYRANAQSFTVDEAWVYNLFVDEKLSFMATRYDACNHVLHTLLMKLARGTLGNSELALRVPSLLAALAYCAGLYRLTGVLFSPWTRLLALALLTLHPLVLDFLIAARGYGLAMALFVWALYCAVSWLIKGQELKWLRLAGVLAGLSVAANLTFAVPAAALGVMLLGLSRKAGPRDWTSVVDGYGVPAVVITFLIVVIPLLPAQPRDFYFGVSSWRESAESLVISIVRVREHWMGGLVAMLSPFLTVVAIPFVLMSLAVALAFVLGRRLLREEPGSWRMAPFALVCGTLTASAAVVFVLHAVAGLRYPVGRTGLYFVPLFILSVLCGISLWPRQRWSRIRTGAYAGAWVLAAVFVSQIEFRYFSDWKFDSRTKVLMRRMDEDFRTGGDTAAGPVAVSSNQSMQHTLRYYRARRKMDWMQDPTPAGPDSKDSRYYILTREQSPLIASLDLEVLERDAVSGSFLARRRP